MHRKIAYALVLALVVAIPFAKAITQSIQFVEYPPITRWDDLIQADGLLQTDPQKAFEIYQRIADQERTTSRAALALMAMGTIHMAWGDPEAEKEIYRRMIRDFPNSVHEIAATQRLWRFEIPDEDNQTYLRESEKMARRFGGPSFESVATRELAAVQRFRQLSPQLVEALSDLYAVLPNIYLRLNDPVRALACAQLNEEMGFEGYLPSTVLQDTTGKSWHERLTQNPLVRVKQPATRTGTRPHIRVEISDGDYQEPQIDYSQLKVLLDGVDIKTKMLNRSKYDTKLRDGHIFQQLRLSYRPAEGLAPGWHSLVVQAQVHGYSGSGLGFTRVEHRFRVDNDCQDEDRREPDDDDYR